MILQIAAIACCALIASAARLAAGTWAHPAPLFCGAWVLFLTVPTAFIGTFNTLPETAWFVVAALLAVATSCTICVRSRDVKQSEVRLKRPRLIRAFIVAASLGAIASALITMSASGISIGRSLSTEALANAARAITAQRYDGTIYTPLAATALLGLAYAAALLAPFAGAATSGKRSVLYTVLPAIGTAGYSLLTTARAPFLICTAVTIAGWLMQRAVTAGGRPIFSAKFAASAIAVGAGIVAIFVVGGATRYGGISSVPVADTLRSAAVYAGGSSVALDQWSPSELPTVGMETFAGISGLLPGDRSGDSLYEFTQIGPGLTTNVYTAFRALVQDFTYAGALIALFVCSTLAAVCYRAAIVLRSPIAAAGVIAWSAFVLFSQTSSIYTFTNVIAGVLIGALVMSLWVEFIPGSSDNEPIPTGNDVQAVKEGDSALDHADVRTVHARMSRNKVML